jgi:predicted metalloprotease with PDZ domain
VRGELHLGQMCHGVVITRVDNGSIADNLGLSRGDVIVSINQQPMSSPQEAADRLKRHREVAEQERAAAAEPTRRDAVSRRRAQQEPGLRHRPNRIDLWLIKMAPTGALFI